MARRQLPLPDGIAPSRRAPPPLPADDDVPPPPVPNRPLPGRPTPSVPSGPPAVPTSSRPSQPKPQPQKPPPEPEVEELYDDGDVGDGDIYDEAAMGGAGSEEEGETYDDAEIGDAADQQEEYADCQVEEEIEPPQESYDEFQGVADDTYEVEEAQEEEIGLMYQECDVGAPVSEELYQIADDETPPPPAPAPPIAAAPALPPPRPKQKRDDAPPPPRNVEKKQPVPKPTGMGMPAIGMGDILNIKDRLKKVQPQKEPEKKEPKQYTDHNELQAKFNFFKNKEREALAKGAKPDITPKPVGFGFKKSIPAKDDKVNSPVSPTIPAERSLPQSRKSSDSLPPVPPPVKEIPSQHRDLPPPPSNATPGLPPPRGKDGYTKVSVTEAEENNNEDDDQEIYDDAISFEDPLLKERWYFGEIDRMVGNDKLKKVGTNGSFLLRKSTKGGNNQPYTLMVLYNDHIYNLKIRERNDGRMAIGEEKPDEMSFMSVENLIKHHQSNDVILVHKDGKQDTTMLIRSPMK